MADAATVIRVLAEQLTQAIVDKTVAEVEVSELQVRLAELLEPKPSGD